MKLDVGGVDRRLVGSMWWSTSRPPQPTNLLKGLMLVLVDVFEAKHTTNNYIKPNNFL